MQQWLSMCKRMPQQYSGIATRMMNMTPIIKEMPQVEVTVDNALAKQEMDELKGRIVKTLIDTLHNDRITLSILLSEKTGQPKVLNRREQFEEMNKKNPAIEILQQELDLELA